MIHIASLLVRARTGDATAARGYLSGTPGVEIVNERQGSFAVVLEAPDPGAQEALHREIAAHETIAEAQLVFQSTPIDGLPIDGLPTDGTSAEDTP